MPGTRTRAWGELEARIQAILWDDGGALTAHEIRTRFDEPLPAYSTVLTTLDRMSRKGQLVREEESPRKVRFSAAESIDEHASATMADALDGAGDREAALLGFAGNLSAEDVTLLRRVIDARRSR